VRPSKHVESDFQQTVQACPSSMITTLQSMITTKWKLPNAHSDEMSFGVPVLLKPSFRALVRNWWSGHRLLGVIRLESTDMASAANRRACSTRLY